MNWLRGLWYKRLRSIDLQILWPCCKEGASSLDHAKASFAVHAFNDRAWMFLGADEVTRRIDGLQ